MDPDFEARMATRAETEKLESELIELAGHLNAANHRFLVLLAEFDRRQGWGDGATKSCAHWLGWKLGMNLGAAREKLRVARALEGLPLISAAMARGELSYSMVRAISRVADAATEAYFLNIAQHGTVHHVENLVRGYRRACEVEELTREIRQHEARRLTWIEDEDGAIVITARMPAENREHGIAIAPNTARTRWLGETMDHGLAVEALLLRRLEQRMDDPG